jgi:YD repeat-containing protein
MFNSKMVAHGHKEVQAECRTRTLDLFKRRSFVLIVFFLALTSGVASADDGQSGAGSTHGTGSPVEGGMDWGTLDAIEVHGFGVAPEVISWNDFNDSFLRSDTFFEENLGDLSPNFGLNADSSKPECSNPIIPSTGAKSEREVDFSSSVLEMPLYLSRTYNSNMLSESRGYELFSGFWSSNFDYWAYAEYDESGMVYIVLARPEGRFIKFKHAGGNRYNEDKSGSIAYVIADSVGMTHYTEDNRVEYFRGGYIQSIRNEHGVGWDFIWAPFQYGGSGFVRQRLQRVVHSSGQYVEFSYNGWDPHVVSSVRDPAGNIYQYWKEKAVWNGQGYYYSGGVIYPDGMTITHHYKWDRGELLLGKSINGVRYSTFNYKRVSDASGHRDSAYSSEHVGGIDKTTFDYGYGSDITKIISVIETNPLGRKTTISFNDKGDVVSVAGQASPHCASSYSSITYDANGYKDVVVDFSGSRTDFDYDAGGHILKKVEAVGTPLARETSYSWDIGKNRLVSETVTGQRRDEYIYDASNRLIEIRSTNISSNGIPNQVRSTTYRYTKHQNGLLSTVVMDGPMQGDTDAVAFSYDSFSNLLTERNSLGQTITYANHNALGQPGRVVDINGAVAEYEYDSRGRVIVERTIPNGSPVELRYVYGVSGLLDAKVSSDGNTTYYHYDPARRLIQEDLTEPGGSHAVKRYTYDAMSNPTKIEIGRDN